MPAFIACYKRIRYHYLRLGATFNVTIRKTRPRLEPTVRCGDVSPPLSGLTGARHNARTHLLSIEILHYIFHVK